MKQLWYWPKHWGKFPKTNSSMQQVNHRLQESTIIIGKIRPLVVVTHWLMEQDTYSLQSWGIITNSRKIRLKMETLKNVPFSPYFTAELLCDPQFILSLYPCGQIPTNFIWLRYLAISLSKLKPSQMPSVQLQSQGGPTWSYMQPMGITSNQLVEI